MRLTPASCSGVIRAYVCGSRVFPEILVEPAAIHSGVQLWGRLLWKLNHTTASARHAASTPAPAANAQRRPEDRRNGTTSAVPADCAAWPEMRDRMPWTR